MSSEQFDKHIYLQFPVTLFHIKQSTFIVLFYWHIWCQKCVEVFVKNLIKTFIKHLFFIAQHCVIKNKLTLVLQVQVYRQMCEKSVYALAHPCITQGDDCSRFVKKWFSAPGCPYSPFRASCMMTSSNGNICRVTGRLCGELTGHRWIPLTKASDAELWCFLWSAPE